MKYRKLELLLMSVGLVGILISVITSMLTGASGHEIFGQLLFIPVLVLALHYGREYGYMAAIVAAIVFLIAKTQEIGAVDFASIEGRLVIFQAGAFGLVGIIGGELAARIKYVVAKIADEELIDEQTHVFSQKYVQKQLGKLFGSYKRDGRPFSVLFVEASWKTSKTDAAINKQLGRIANILRSNVRLVDEVGYLSDGRFCLVLPDTPADGASALSRRLEKAYRGATQHSRFSAEWQVSCLTLPGDEGKFSELAPALEQVPIIA